MSSAWKNAVLALLAAAVLCAYLLLPDGPGILRIPAGWMIEETVAFMALAVLYWLRPRSGPRIPFGEVVAGLLLRRRRQAASSLRARGATHWTFIGPLLCALPVILVFAYLGWVFGG